MIIVLRALLAYSVRKIAFNAFESVVDNAIKETIREPAIGGAVYCDLALGHAEHSGIYIGNGLIAHLNRFGTVETVDRAKFLEGTPAFSIYTSCVGTMPIGYESAAIYAKRVLEQNRRRRYNVILENCHMFTSECITGEKSSNTFLWMLKHESEKHHGTNNWRVWEA